MLEVLVRYVIGPLGQMMQIRRLVLVGLIELLRKSIEPAANVFDIRDVGMRPGSPSLA